MQGRVKGIKGRGIMSYLLDVHVIQVILHKLDAGIEVRGVEFVWDVPAQRTEFPPLLNHRVQEGHSIEHGSPLRHIGDI